MKSLTALLLFPFFIGAKELDGTYLPTNNPCPTPEEARAKMTVPEGYAVKCFAHEPMVQNPVAMTWDARGRLWVVEAYEYPEGSKLPAPFGGEAKNDQYQPLPPNTFPTEHGTRNTSNLPRDRVIILEDTDNNGEADKRTVFVEGLNLASAILCGDNGIYVGQQPHLIHFLDADHDDKPEQWRVVLTGFGREDTHELVNSFCWGPDGWLYMTHGVFTHSKVRRPGQPESEGFKFDAGIGRCRPLNVVQSSGLPSGPSAQRAEPHWEFEVFADGTSNPWGCDYDASGNFFVSACVIDHFFHMAPGGIYVRQGGAPENPYAYEQLPSIVKHKHFRAAYAGVQIYQGGVYPKDTWGHAFIGNIHDNAIHEEVITPVGSSFKCEPRRDFLRANDGWFRPVSTQTGPDGNLWVMDWCDKYPCYQNAKANPDGVDRSYGRIWRVIHIQICPPAPPDLSKLATEQLVKQLENPNNWVRRMAKRMLAERGEQKTKPDQDLALRAGSADIVQRVSAAIELRTQTGAQLTVSHSVPHVTQAMLSTLTSLIKASKSDAQDRISFHIWQALEPMLTANPVSTMAEFTKTAPEAQPLSEVLSHKAMRRLCDTRKAENLDLALDYLNKVKLHEDLLANALSGLVKGQEGGVIKPTKEFSSLLAEFTASKNVEVRKHSQTLATLWGDSAAIDRLATLMMDAKTPEAERISALQTLRKVRNDAAQKAYSTLVARVCDPGGVADGQNNKASSPTADAFALEVIRAATELGGDSFPAVITAHWQKLSPTLQVAALDALASRPAWTKAMLNAIEAKQIPSTGFPASVRRQLATSADKPIRDLANKVLGAWKDSSNDVKAIIAAKRKACLEGEPDLAAGKLLFTTTCAVCHTFHGGGQKVGPELIGSGRSNLDALLANVIDPNQIIGNGYENIIINTKDNRTLMGRITEDTPSHVKLLAIGGAEQVVPRDQIAKLDNTKQSLMPMGFGGLPDDQFRNLIWYILAPPEEGPLTAEKKKLLSTSIDAAPEKPKSPWRNIDWESVSLWNPAWKVNAPDFERTPLVLADYHGRKNVLLMHPFPDKKTPASLEFKGVAKSMLKLSVAADDRGDWMLKVLVNGEPVKELVVDHEKPRWKEVVVDTLAHAGKEITVRLEGHATGWAWEFGYWSEVKWE